MIQFVVPAVRFAHNALFKWCGSLGKLCKGVSMHVELVVKSLATACGV